MNDPILQTQDLKLYYGAFQALKGINMEIAEKTITALIGPSGCGKSTFLKTLNRMNDPELVPGLRVEGKALYRGQDIFDKSVDVTLLRKKIGMVFQKPNPFPMSIYDNIAYGPRLHGAHSKAKLDEIVEKSLRGAAIWDEVKDRSAAAAVHRPGSGGGAGRIADGRTHQRPGPRQHHENRGTDERAEGAVHRGHRDPQYAAGCPYQRRDGVFPAGRDGGKGPHGRRVLPPQG